MRNLPLAMAAGIRLAVSVWPGNLWHLSTGRSHNWYPYWIRQATPGTGDRLCRITHASAFTWRLSPCEMRGHGVCSPPPPPPPPPQPPFFSLSLSLYTYLNIKGAGKGNSVWYRRHRKTDPPKPISSCSMKNSTDYACHKKWLQSWNRGKSN